MVAVRFTKRGRFEIILNVPYKPKKRKTNGKIQTFNVIGKSINIYSAKSKQKYQKDSERTKARPDDYLQRNKETSGDTGNGLRRSSV